VVPYYALEADTQNVRKPWWKKFADALSAKETPEKIVERYRTYQRNSKFLDTRVSVVIEGLRGVGIYAERLDLVDLISLMFKEYNPDSHKDQATVV
jgi:N-glycosylase/DNA lyase